MYNSEENNSSVPYRASRNLNTSIGNPNIDVNNTMNINIQNIMTSSSTDISDIFTGMPPNFVICYPLSGASKIDNEIKNNSCRVRDCNDNWMTSQKK